MRIRTAPLMTALAVGLLAVASSAQAAFQYTTAPDPAFFTSGGGTTIISGLGTLNAGPTYDITGLNTPTQIVFANPTFTSTATTPQAVTFNYGYTVTIINPSGSGVGTPFTITGTITGTGSQSTAILSDINDAVNGAPSATANIGGVNFLVTALPGTAPQANGVPGSLIARIENVGVPEPASVALLGLGGLGAFGLFRRRAARA